MTKKIDNLIYTIRGKQIMIDSDVAKLYEYKVKRINEVVKRNRERFPENFCFKLTKTEYQNLKSQDKFSDLEIVNFNNSSAYNFDENKKIMRSQIATTLVKRNNRYLPFAFTEQGIVMLAGLLKNEKAIDISIKIVEAFVEMRRFISNNSTIYNRLSTIEYKLLEHDKNFTMILDKFKNNDDIKEAIFFEGQIYDAHSLLIDIIKKAKNEIIIIDGYIDKTLLDLLTEKNKEATIKIITKKQNQQISNLDLTKFNKQYPALSINYSNKYHDRFIIIDKNILYHCGASLKDLGTKVFAINKIEDKILLKKLFNDIQKFDIKEYNAKSN